MTLRPVAYVPDSEVDAGLNAALIGLLTVCFTKPQDVVFRKQRYFIDCPQHRWLLFSTTGALIAHAAVHEKTVKVDGAAVEIGGVSEVCVHPDHRRQGHVGKLLADAHAFMRSRGWPYSALSGDTEVYRSAGYRPVANLYYTPDGGRKPFPKAMVKELDTVAWPDSDVELVGNFF